MAKLIGNIDYVPQPGYPKFSGEKGQEKITVQYVQALDKVSLPDYDTKFYDERYPFFSRFTNLILKHKSTELMRGAMSMKTTLEYASAEEGVPGVAAVEGLVECENVELDVPIEQHPNYCYCWNHDLQTTEAEDGHYWTDWEKDKKNDIPSGYTDFCKWAPAGDKPETGWMVSSAASKPGVESFKAYSPEVVAVRKARNKKSLTKTMDKDGTPQTPPETFGRAGEWLQSGSTIKKEGGLWVLRTSYLNSRVIDTDIYPVPATGS